MAHNLDRTIPVDDQLSIFDFTYRDAHDVVQFAERSPMLSGAANCESWHLGRDGAFTCGTNGTALDSLRQWASNPERLVQSFLEFRTRGTCTPRWVIVDERSAAYPGDNPAPSEADIEHFMRLRYQLEVVGITLLDAVIFDGAERWWSICELLTGSCEWGAAPFPHVDVSRLRRVA
jgi:hypothetical protein